MSPEALPQPRAIRPTESGVDMSVPQIIRADYGMEYGPAKQGAELLAPEQLHLLSENLNVGRSIDIHTGQAKFVEAGWRANKVYKHEETGQLMVEVQKPEGETYDRQMHIAASRKSVPISMLEGWNPNNSNENEDTISRSQLSRDKILGQIDGPWVEHEVKLSDGHDAGKVGEPAVKQVVEEPQLEKAENATPEAVVGKVAEKQDTPVAVERVEDSASTAEQSQQPEIKIPALQEIFSSAESLVHTLRDPEVAPEVKSSLQNIVDTWKEIEKIDASQQLWDTFVKPGVERMATTASSSSYEIATIVERTTELQTTLKLLAEAAAYGGQNGVMEILQRRRFGDNAGEVADLLIRRAKSSDEITVDSVRAMFDTEEAQLQQRRLSRADTGSVTVEEADAIIDKLAEILPNAPDLVSVLRFSNASLDDKEKSSPNWRSKYDAVQETIRFARVGAAIEPERLGGIVNDLEMMRDQMRRGRYDPADMDQMVRILNPILEDFDRAGRFMKMAELYVNEIK